MKAEDARCIPSSGTGITKLQRRLSAPMSGPNAAVFASCKIRSDSCFVQHRGTCNPGMSNSKDYLLKTRTQIWQRKQNLETKSKG